MTRCYQNVSGLQTPFGAQNTPHFALSSPFWVLPVTGGSERVPARQSGSRRSDVRSAETPPGRLAVVLKVAGVTNSPQLESNLIKFLVGRFAIVSPCDRCPFQNDCPECPYVPIEKRKNVSPRPCDNHIRTAPQERFAESRHPAICTNAAALELAYGQRGGRA